MLNAYAAVAFACEVRPLHWSAPAAAARRSDAKQAVPSGKVSNSSRRALRRAGHVIAGAPRREDSHDTSCESGPQLVRR